MKGGDNMARHCLIAALLWVVGLALAQPATAQRATVSVTPVKYDAIINEADYPSSILKQEIEAGIAATRTFTVLSSDADELDALLNEIMAAGSNRITPRNQSAQFVVVPVVQAFELETKVTPIPRLSGQVRVETEGEIRMRVRVLETRTGELKAPFAVDVDWESEPEVMGGSAAIGVTTGTSDFVDMAREAGRVLADKLLDQVYPVQVIARDGEDVWLSRGADGGYDVGERLRVLSGAGDSDVLRHPVTGEILGVREKRIGEIEVTSVEPKFTVAKIVEETGTIGEGAIVRR